MIIYADFGISGYTDLRYRFYDAYNYPIGDWVTEDIHEETEDPGLYYTDTDVPYLATTVRWKRTSVPATRRVVPVHLKPVKTTNSGMVKLDEDHFEYYLDTRNHLNGEATITVLSKGSDGFWAKAEVDVTILNDLNNNTYYKEFFCSIQNSDLLINKVHFGIDSYALSPSIQRRGWMQIGVRTSGTDLSPTADIEACETWWEQLTPVPLKKGISWKKTDTELIKTSELSEAILTQFHVDIGLELPAERVAFGIRVTPTEILTGYDLDADGIIKIREYVAGKFLILTTGPTRLWIYDKEGIELFRDLTEFGLEDAVDATYIGTTVYVAQENGKLFQIYAEDEKTNFELVPAGETKKLRFLENDGTNAIAIYDDNTNVKTTAYSLYDLSKVWEVSFSFDFIHVVKGKLIGVKGTRIYVSEDAGMTIPVLDSFSDTADDFPYPIVAVSEQLVATNNGNVYYKNPDTEDFDLLIQSNETDITSVEYARVGAEGLRAFLGKEDNQLFESNLDLSWSDARVLESSSIDGDDIESIGAMWHFEEETVASTGTQGSYDYVAPQYDDRLLIGTNGPTGEEKAMLIVLQKSAINEKHGAQLVSQISYPDIFPEEVTKKTLVPDVDSTPEPTEGPVVDGE